MEKYIKLSDAVEMLQKEKRDAERGYEEFGFAISFIHAVTYGGVIKMLETLPTVEVEDGVCRGDGI